jgi:PAS domain S-box-containing protein
MHFALNPGGFLFLGSTESVEGSADLFVVVDKDAHIYQSRAIAARINIPIPELAVPSVERRFEQEASLESRTRERMSAADLHLRLLEQYAAPSIVVNEDHDIVHMSESAGRYLQFTGGEPSHNLLRVIRPELRLELRTALYQAAQQRTNVAARNLGLRIDDRNVRVDLLVRPVLRQNDPARGFFLVLIEESDTPSGEVAAQDAESAPVSPVDAARQLEDELVRLKAQLRATIERHETQAEELKASNEELQAMNEELRSSAEELETSKEELQSLNEELRTVNQELKIKIEEQAQATNDIQNLINSTEIGTIFLDRLSRIKLFTPRTRDIFSLIPVDRGRQLSDISSHLVYDGLPADIDRVLDRLERIEREVQTRDGRWHLMRLLPYRTDEDRIDGVVLTFVDITERKLAEEALRRSEERMRFVLESVPDAAIITLEANGLIDSWNAGAAALFGYSDSEAIGKPLDLLFTPEDRERDAAGEELRRAKETGRALVERWHSRGDGRRLFVSGSLSALRNDEGTITGYVKVVKDLTDRKKEEETLQQAKDELDARVRERTRELAEANAALDLELRERRDAEERIRKLLKRVVTIQEDERRRFARDLHDHLGQQITALRLTLETAKPGSTPAAANALAEALRMGERLDRDLDLFTAELRPPALDDLGLVSALAQYVNDWSRTAAVSAQFHSSGLKDARLAGELESNLFRIAQEALNNVHKHAQASRVDVFLGHREGKIVLIVEDNGRGFEAVKAGADKLARGFGLVGMRERAAQIEGKLEIETSPGKGTTVFVNVPASFIDDE